MDIPWTPRGHLVDIRGHPSTSRGHLVDSRGHLVDISWTAVDISWTAVDSRGHVWTVPVSLSARDQGCMHACINACPCLHGHSCTPVTGPGPLQRRHLFASARLSQRRFRRKLPPAKPSRREAHRALPPSALTARCRRNHRCPLPQPPPPPRHATRRVGAALLRDASVGGAGRDGARSTTVRQLALRGVCGALVQRCPKSGCNQYTNASCRCSEPHTLRGSDASAGIRRLVGRQRQRMMVTLFLQQEVAPCLAKCESSGWGSCQMPPDR
eukprot:365234-Chlamydomonas_euryale.AAC.8